MEFAPAVSHILWRIASQFKPRLTDRQIWTEFGRDAWRYLLKCGGPFWSAAYDWKIEKIFCKTGSFRTCFSAIPIGKSFNSRKARRPISEWPTSSIENVICFGRCEITEPNGTFPFLLIVVFFRCQSCLFSFFVSIFMQRNGFGKKKLPRSKVGVYIFGSKVSSETSVIKRPDHF